MRFLRFLLRRAGSPHRHEREDHREKGDGVEQVDERESGRIDRHPRGGQPGAHWQAPRVPGEDQSRDCRPSDHRGLENRKVERKGARELAGRNESREKGVARRPVERPRGPPEEVQGVQEPEGLPVGEGQARERERHRRHAELREDHDAPPVAPVGDDSSPERKRDDRHDAGQPHEPERQRRARQQVDVPVDSHHLHLRPDHREELANNQPPIIPVPQRVIGPPGGCHTANDSERRRACAESAPFVRTSDDTADAASTVD